jgi:predicted glycosyltransferase
MKIMVYCQHVLGVGHICRIMLILEQLRDHRVCLVLGGPPVTVTIPAHVEVFQLPGLRMDEEFSGLLPVTGGLEVETIKQQRKQQLQELFRSLEPDLLLVELFPFGRNGFRFELLPLLELARQQKKCRIACSVRDILVDRDNTVKFEQRVIDRLNSYFHLLLIHGDPALIRLEQTFSRMTDIRIPIAYTGYVCAVPKPDDRKRIRSRLGMGTGKNEKLILVSAGSGSVGINLIRAAASAFTLLKPGLCKTMLVFTGPYLSDNDFKQLASDCHNSRTADRIIRIERFTNDFPAWLAAADLSISMAGYNTTMNLIAAGCPALVYPFAQNHEQRMRAERLEERGLLQMLTEQELEPGLLAKKITRSLAKEPVPDAGIMLDGARQTAGLLGQLGDKQ